MVIPLIFPLAIVWAAAVVLLPSHLQFLPSNALHSYCNHLAELRTFHGLLPHGGVRDDQGPWKGDPVALCVMAMLKYSVIKK